MSLKPGKNVEFDMKKHFQFVKELGEGGTGKTFLFKEDITQIYFAIKKYEPIEENKNKENFHRFIDEIKILFKLTHPHIVRIYNYYLYEEHETGYLQMEYIEGEPIDEYDPINRGKDWNTIFLEVISAFEYLESCNILHRDIRPQNILIDQANNVKIIDFGFGKMLTEEEQEGKSIFLNWPYSIMPEEVEAHDFYDFQTELYFVGSLFKILLKDEYENFKYKHIINEMTEYTRNKRLSSFKDVTNTISGLNMISGSFTESEKQIYNEFAEALINSINHFINDFNPNTNIKNIENGLEELLLSSSLEHTVQNNSKLIDVFISNSYNYRKRSDIDVEVVEKFYQMIKVHSEIKQKIIIDNIITRLDTIKIESRIDDLPF